MPAVRQYSVLTLASDPGVPLVAVGAGLLLAGLLPSLYVRRRRVWARVEPAGDGTNVRLAGLAMQGKPAFTGEFAALVDRVDAALRSPAGTSGPTLGGASRAPSTPGED
jgi:cytochrome c biogenesis protein